MSQTPRPAGQATSVLFITAAPDDRPSTRSLGLLVQEIDSRPDSSATLWYLRTGYGQQPRAGTRTVDSLRTWTPSELLENMGLGTPAAWIRGRKLRRWLKQVGPDIVVLDDGLGRRVIDSLRPSPRLAIRLNEPRPDDVEKEDPATSSGDLVITPAGLDVPPTGSTNAWSIEEPLVALRSREAARFSESRIASAARRDLGLPEKGPLLVGWGDDGWLDGPDLFVRTLWTLEHRYDVVAHGVWFGLTADPHEIGRLRQEADRCGISERFHHRRMDATEGRLCGDAAFLPYRSTACLDDLLEAACSGSLVVAFAAAQVDDPLVRTVPDLDIERAAAEIAEGLGHDRRIRSARARERFEPGVCRDILALG